MLSEIDKKVFLEVFLSAFQQLTPAEKKEVIREFCSGVQIVAEHIVKNKEEIWAKEYP